MPLSIARPSTRRTLLLALGSLLLATSPAGADPMRFELSDGSVITGELLAVEDGQLAIDSKTLGRLRIPQSKVASMRPLGAAPTPAPARAASPSGASSSQVMALQQMMMSDPALLEEMASLQASPLMQEILSDPELMQKIMAGDVEALSRDPRIQQLAEDPTVRSIRDKVGE